MFACSTRPSQGLISGKKFHHSKTKNRIWKEQLDGETMRIFFLFIRIILQPNVYVCLRITVKKSHFIYSIQMSRNAICNIV